MDNYLESKVTSAYLDGARPTARTSLADRQPISGLHSLTEAVLNGKINLRGELSDPLFIEGVMQALQATLPREANTALPFLGGLIFWLGPDEWLIHCKLRDMPAQVGALRKALSQCRSAVTDVSDYSTVIELSGPLSREIIASGCPFDTRVSHFKPGQCAQTRFGHASVLMWPIDEQSTFALQVRWSFAPYLYDYLAQSIANAERLAEFTTS